MVSYHFFFSMELVLLLNVVMEVCNDILNILTTVWFVKARLHSFLFGQNLCFCSLLSNISVSAQVSFGRDFEQQLSFCVEARATFCNLEPVLVQLIHVSTNPFIINADASSSVWCSNSCLNFQTVNRLAMETRRVMKGNHSRKTAAFVRVSGSVSISQGFPTACSHLCLEIYRRSSLRSSVVVCPGLCSLQLHHHPVPQQHLQSSQPLPALWSGGTGQSVSLSRWKLRFVSTFHSSWQVKASCSNVIFSGNSFVFPWLFIHLCTYILHLCLLFDLFYFRPPTPPYSWCLLEGSRQCSPWGSSLHQHWRQTTLLWEFPAGLCQQLPGHSSSHPCNVYFLSSVCF